MGRRRPMPSGFLRPRSRAATQRIQILVAARAPDPLLLPARQPFRTLAERPRPWPSQPAGDQEAGAPV